jgi:arylsulfatase A-like enzyme
VREDVAQHYNNVHRMDAEVARVLAQLEADGLADSTIVVWTTDHGDGLPRAKRELYDAGLQVPMIIRWPEAYRPAGVQPGSVDERLVSFVDLGPTLLSLAGAEVPGFAHGRKLAALGGESRRYVYASRDRIDEVLDRQRAVRDERFKLIRSYVPEQPGGHPLAFRDNQEIMRELWRLKEAGELNADQLRWFEPPGRERLFDLRADPHELHDVSGDPAYAQELARMRTALDAWLARVEDWSEVPEDDLVARLWPGGEQPLTEPPQLSVRDGEVSVRAKTLGSSLGYRIDEGPWQLYTAPFVAPQGAVVTAKAVRYGWQESEERTATRGD